MRRLVLVLAGASLLVSGCSTRPRLYAPTLALPAADSAAYERELAGCRVLVASGKRSGFGDAAVVTGAGAATGAAAGAAVVGTGAIPVGIGMSTGAAVAALAIMPLAGVAAGIGVTRAIRSGKEKKINRAMSECLAAHGYGVSSWQLEKKVRKGAPPPAPAE